jgi:hypothetical protein
MIFDSGFLNSCVGIGLMVKFIICDEREGIIDE